MNAFIPLAEAWEHFSAKNLPVPSDVKESGAVQLSSPEWRGYSEIEIEVTAEDIFGAIPGSPWRCPVSCAISRTTGFRASVSRRSVGFYDRSLGIHFPYCVADLPSKVSRFIRRFDGNAFWPLPAFIWKRPFKFWLSVPE